MLRFIVFVFALVVLLVSSARAQSPAATPLDEAAELARRADWRAAEAAYETLVRADAADARAWFGLRAARQEQGRHREALEALAKAEELRFPNRVLLLRKARAHARRGEADSAFAALDALVHTGYAGAEALEALADLAPLRGVARFAETLAPARRNTTACVARPEFRQFDFWAGEWDVYPAGVGERVGRGRIALILYRCVVEENWTAKAATSAKATTPSTRPPAAGSSSG